MEVNKRLHGKGWLAVPHNTINSKHNQAKSETLLKKYIGERATEREPKEPSKKKKRKKKRGLYGERRYYVNIQLKQYKRRGRLKDGKVGKQSIVVTIYRAEHS